jgi:hypothetical protein
VSGERARWERAWERAGARARRLAEAVRPSSKTFKRSVAILITIASVTAAVAAWRAEDRARIAEENDREGFAQGVAGEQAKAQIYSDLEDVVIDYAHARSLRAEARALRAQARRSDPAEAAVLHAQARVDDQRAGGIFDSINPDAFVKGTKARRVTIESLTGQSPGADSKLEIDLRFRRTQQDLVSAPEFREADDNFTRSDLDVGFAALAIASAFFFTLVQISRTRATYVYLGGGLLTLLTAIVALIVVELT